MAYNWQIEFLTPNLVTLGLKLFWGGILKGRHYLCDLNVSKYSPPVYFFNS